MIISILFLINLIQKMNFEFHEILSTYSSFIFIFFYKKIQMWTLNFKKTFKF